MNKNQVVSSTKLSIDEQIAAKIIVSKNMKLSVVWRQIDSAIADVSKEVSSYNAALAKTLPLLKKKALANDFQGVLDGKYIKFPDGSQAKY